jgi:hypothetical protein
MSRGLMKKYIDILMEALSYSSLQDAGDDYSPGNTQIWYWREDLGRDMMMGYDFLKKQNKLPDPANLSATHVLIGSVAETNLDKIYSMMQSESWSPQDEARDLINKSGAGHTSMSVGDIIVINNDASMVDKVGFVNLATGEEI